MDLVVFLNLDHIKNRSKLYYITIVALLFVEKNNINEQELWQHNASMLNSRIADQQETRMWWEKCEIIG